MKHGERRRLYRSCRHLIVFLLLLGGAAVRAQNTDPLRDVPARPQPRSDVAERTAASAHAGSYAKLSAQGDTTVVITPGKRDFLEPNAPNPFGSGSTSTRISYSISEESRVQLKVYDFFYEEIAVLVDSLLPAGYYTVVFDPKGRIPSGMYFYELKTERTRELRRMLYVK
jgi:hypothetical protein